MTNLDFKKFNFYFHYYLIFILTLAIIFLFIKHDVGNDSTISEWLINYQGGFVRRGLPGEIFFRLSIFFNIEIRLIIFLFQAFFYIIFIFLTYLFFKEIDKNYFLILSILSPLFLIYPVAEIEVLARKEILLFIHFYLFVIFFDSYKKKTIFFSLSYPILLLVWEPIVFFIGFYLLVLSVNLKKEFKKHILLFFIFFIPSILIILIIIFNNYTLQNQDIMCFRLEKFVGEKCYMSLGYVTTSIWENFYSVLHQLKIEHIIRYLIGITLGFSPLVYLFYNSILNADLIIKKNILVILSLIYSMIIILFIMGQDWGRWVNITYFYSLITFCFFLKEKKILVEFKLYKKNKIFKFFNKKKYAILIIILFAFTWNFKTLFKGDIGSLPQYRSLYKIIKLNL